MGAFFRELRHRGMFRVTAGYLVAAWLILQVTAAIEEAARLPAWVDGVALIALIAVFPMALFIAWRFDITPDGLRRTAPLKEGDAVKPVHGLDYGIFAVLAVVCGVIVWQIASRPEFFSAGDQVALVTPSDMPPPTPPADAPELSVAVLPFIAMSSNEDDGYFADGLTEEILNSLAAIPELLVTSRTSAFQFRGPDLPAVPEIARSLNVAHVLEGSVRRAGDQVRVTAQLIRASDDRHLWSQTYDRPMADIFAIQEEIASNVADVLQIVLDEDQRRLMRNSGTRNFEAYIAYQQALELWNEAHSGGDYTLLEQAEPYFAHATESAPDFYQAWLLRADRHSHLLLDMSEGRTEYDETVWQQYATERDVLLDAALDSAETQAQRSIVAANRLLFSDDWGDAYTVVFDSLGAQGCVNDNWLQSLVGLYPDLDARLAYNERLVACDPLNPEALMALGDVRLARGEYEEALVIADRLAELDRLDESEFIKLDALMGLGRFDEAEEMLIETWIWDRYRLSAMRADTEAMAQTHDELASGDDWSALIINAIAGRREEANAAAARIDARPLGSVSLVDAIMGCGCGAPFDLDATPNFAARLEGSGLAWPPTYDLGFPLMEADGTP